MNNNETFRLAFENHQKSNFPVAIELYKEVLKNDPNDFSALNNLGSVFFAQGKKEKAKEYYKKAIKINPKYTDAYNNLAILFRNLGRNQEAINILKNLIKINPNIPDSYNILGNIFKDLKDYQKSKEYYEKSIEIDSNFANAHNNLGVVFKILGEYQKAKNSCEKAIEVDRNHLEARFNLGLIYRILGEEKKAINYFNEILDAVPNHVNALNELGKISHKSKKYHEAISYHEKAIEIDPNFVDAYYCLALVFASMKGQSKKGIDYNFKVLELNPNHASANYNIAHIFQKLANYPEAIKHYEKAIAISPNNTNAHNNLGTVFKETGEYQKALVCYQDALASDSNNTNALFNLGEILHSHGKDKEAIIHLRKLKSKSGNELILKCLYKLGDETLFFRELDEHIKKGEINATIGSLVSRSGIRFKNKKQNLFCEDPLKFTLKTDLTKVCNFNNIFVEPIKDILKKDILSSRRQDLLTNGLQTGGNLFNNEFEFLEKIKPIIISEVEKYRLHFKNNDEGFLKYWPTDFDLKGWIVNMKSGGKLSPHMHEHGWVSGSIYINVPPKLKNDSGNLVLSIMGDEEKSGLSPKKIMDVATGSLCLFPASLLHYTIPFESDEERIVLAFDISCADKFY